MDMADLAKEVGKEAKKAIEDLSVETEHDMYKVREAINKTLAEITAKLAAGQSIESIIDEYDTVTTMQLAEILAKAGEKQAKIMKLTKGLLDTVVCILIRQVLLSV